MSLSYDFEKSIILGLIAMTIALIVGLIILLNPFAHGQVSQTATQGQIESYQALINYCFQHADRPNPIQDLIDKGFLSSEFKGETCMSVKQTYDRMIED